MYEKRLIKAFTLGIQGLPDEIQWMPPGKHSITPSRNGKPIKLTVQVNEAAAQAVKESLDALKAEKKRPYLDFNHEGGRAAAMLEDVFWGGDDPETGGIRARVSWTNSGQEAVEGKDFNFFSPSFFIDPKTNEITGAPVNFGGLVNEPAFTSIMPLAASHTNQRNNMKELLQAMSAAGLISEVDQEEGALVAEFKQNFSPIQANAAKAPDLETQLQTAQEEIKAHAKERANTLIDQAITAGKLPPKDEATHAFWRDQITAGNAGAVQALEALPVNAKLSQTVEHKNLKGNEDSGDRTITAKQNAAVEQVLAGSPNIGLDAAWERAATADPELFSK